MPLWRPDPDWRKHGGYSGSGRVVDAGESDLDFRGELTRV